jgi:hypothetical protein
MKRITLAGVDKKTILLRTGKKSPALQLAPVTGS